MSGIWCSPAHMRIARYWLRRRAALQLGYKVTVVSDALAGRDGRSARSRFAGTQDCGCDVETSQQVVCRVEAQSDAWVDRSADRSVVAVEGREGSPGSERYLEHPGQLDARPVLARVSTSPTTKRRERDNRSRRFSFRAAKRPMRSRSSARLLVGPETTEASRAAPNVRSALELRQHRRDPVEGCVEILDRGRI